ncbi:penicillin-binding protein, 1A family [Gemmatirosa kalamazoonensis]|uniref:peptidoglycan glycosyltransferase n=1 Tax=Gemmatirosa kalamazoonensis TaxID=861299 RepID=W0RLM5_9BACT|nr:PBP1A family penicillin-binding protein [Gemmatirosa kalamazoonensis]AHG91989.1 penicillin-binding protein, 1A family [Gemmatirosa kalamazoonensis]
MSATLTRRPAFTRAALLLLLAAGSLGAQPPQASTGEPWRIVPLTQSTVVYARDGAMLGEIGRQVRTSVSLRTIPRYVPNAFIAVEDKRFYQHNGVDVVGIAGALKDAVTGDVRGASTITQLLVGNMHPDAIDRRDRSPARKLREQKAALEMERHYNKEQILEAFLNTLDFGHGWFGIDAAARHYFGHPAAQLTLAEAASLASMPKSPVLYDPSRHPDRNRERRNTVLALMAEQGMITRAQADAAMAEPLRTAPNGGMAATAPWVLDVVRIQAERAGVPVREGGYRIVTTIDPKLQQAAVDALAEQTAAIEKRPGYRHATYAQAKAKNTSAGARETSYLQGAVVAIEPSTGEVRALVGGRDYEDSPFDRAIDAQRQPGSSFKPIVYAAAVAAGLPPNAPVGDTAIAVPLPNGQLYRPENSDDSYLGIIPLREALARSRNPVAVQLWTQLGPDSVIALARRMGIRSPIAPYPSSAIGASVVQPLDFVTAYATFANLGVAVEPRFVTKVEDRAGKVVWAPASPPPQLALDPRVAFIVRDMMRDVVDRGTATSVRKWLPARVPIAGKTGTTNDNADVWFVGVTPDLVMGAWLGFDKPKTITAGAVGGTLAAPVVAQALGRWYAGREPATWSPPAGLVTMELDRQTGLPADAATPPERRYTEYFIDGTQPGAQKFDAWSIFRHPGAR